MADDADLVEIIQARPAEGIVADRKSGRLDDMGLDIEAGAEPQNRSGILGNVGLIKSEAHRGSGLVFADVLGRNVTSSKGFAALQCCVAIAGLRSFGKGANRTILNCAVPPSKARNGALICRRGGRGRRQSRVPSGACFGHRAGSGQGESTGTTGKGLES